MAEEKTSSFEGGCTCGEVSYRMNTFPMYVHCCHCRWCQRETGSSFVVNAMIEADQVEILAGEVEITNTPTLSGGVQKISRCPGCSIAMWSNYAGAGDGVHFLRVGTLDDPDMFPPEAHIFTMSKQPWVILPDGVPAFNAFYDFNKYWPKESLDRRKKVKRL